MHSQCFFGLLPKWAMEAEKFNNNKVIFLFNESFEKNMSTQIIEKIYIHTTRVPEFLKCAHILGMLVGRQFVMEVTLRHMISIQTV